jgi:hypothetical protein
MGDFASAEPSGQQTVHGGQHWRPRLEPLICLVGAPYSIHEATTFAGSERKGETGDAAGRGVVRGLCALVAGIATSAVLIAAVAVCVLTFAGPHSDFPEYLMPLVGFASLALVTVVPIWVGREVWRSLGRGEGRGSRDSDD